MTGGTLRPDAPSYVERQADQDVYEGLLSGEFRYVLTSRQMGKSSLMVRTMARLRAAGVQAAALDLSAIGQNVTPEQWYTGLLASLGEQLGLEDQMEEVWSANSRMGWLQRWFRAVRMAVLDSRPGALVIFVDEIDSILSLPFSTDEFFGAIRECYNRRPKDPELDRLTFCLMGVTTPSDLVRDKRITPFNIGRRIELSDFTEREAAPLAAGLHADPGRAAALLKRVLYWTSGHPYLTQRLCLALASEARDSRPGDVDRNCEELFFTIRSRDRDDNLVFVRERMLRSHPDVAGLLEMYSRVRRGRWVPDVETDPLGSVLRLSGIVRWDNGRLRIRNRIYDRVFDRAWIRAAMPDAELHRQRAAFWLGVLRTAGISAVVVLAMGIMLAITLSHTRDGYVSQAKATLVSGAQGQRHRSLELISKAVPAFSDDAVLRNLAIKALALFDLKDGRTWPGWRLRTRSVALNSDFTLYARGDLDGNVVVENTANQPEVVRLGATGSVERLVFSPDDRYLAAKVQGETNAGAVVWDLRDHQQILRVSREVHERALEFSPDSLRIACGHLDGSVAIYRLTGAQGAVEPEVQVAKDSQQPAKWLRFNPGASKLAWCSDGSPYVRICDLETRQVRSVFYHPVRVLDIAWHPNGEWLATACQSGEIYLWDPRLPNAPRVLGRHDGEARLLAFNHHGDLLASYGADKVLALWVPFTGRQLTCRVESEGPDELLFSADDSQLGVHRKGGDVGVWKINPGMEYRVLAAPLGISAIESLDFSPDGGLLAAASNDGIIVWEAAEGREVQSLKEVATRSALFDPASGDLLASGGYGFRRWRPAGVSTGAPLPFAIVDARQTGEFGQFAPAANGGVAAAFLPGIKMPGITDPRPDRLCVFDPKIPTAITNLQELVRYRALAISPDGRYVAAQSADNGQLHLWDVERGALLEGLWRSDTGTSFAFSPAGGWLATTSGWDGPLLADG